MVVANNYTCYRQLYRLVPVLVLLGRLVSAPGEYRWLFWDSLSLVGLRLCNVLAHSSIAGLPPIGDRCCR